MVQFDIDILNMRFEYLDMDMVSDIEYPDSNIDRFEPLQTNSVSNTVEKYHS